MYTITSGIFIHFGHHIRGHDGPCISLHGHTWQFQVTVQATELDDQGFILDFDKLQARVLDPCHALLDHGFAMGADTWSETKDDFTNLGEKFVRTRHETIGSLGDRQPGFEGELIGARNEWPGGVKVAVFPFTPTSERLAKWLFELGQKVVGDDRVSLQSARIFETMHPVEFVAEYRP